jgi:predicted metal-dependent phosphoesterase TrpH
LEYETHVNIDLHIHSTASDGTLTPLEILRLAQELNLGAIAITDHDTVAAAQSLFELGLPASPKFISGVEISALPPPSFSFLGSFHVLGYCMDVYDPILNQTLDRLRQARTDRNPRMVEALNALGIHITLQDVLKEAGDCQLGRPHIAQQMVKQGVVRSIDEAFDKFLKKGKPAYVNKYRVDCAKAIEIILGAGGLPVLAHPFLLEVSDAAVFENLIITLKAMGLKGLEVYYPNHPPQQTALYAQIARRHHLLMTGGTDFHGAIKPEIKLGIGKGNFCVPYELYEALILAHSKI